MWPDEVKCEKWVDWSWYQNHGWPLHKPFDVDAFCAANPYIDGAIIRAIWPNGVPDKHYAHYYDGFKRNGKKTCAYVWPNPQKSIAQVRDNIQNALGDRVPPIIGNDYEEASTFQGVSNAKVTQTMRDHHDMMRETFVGEAIINYSRGSWLSSRIQIGSWFHDIPWLLAHYIYPNPDVAKQATQFSQIDALLPIDNGFTPYRGPVREENVIGWQFSSKLEIVPNGTSDGDYFLKSFLDPIYNQPGPPPPEPKVPVEVHVPAGKVDVRVIET